LARYQQAHLQGQELYHRGGGDVEEHDLKVSKTEDLTRRINVRRADLRQGSPCCLYKTPRYHSHSANSFMSCI
jgi:hypothetical protein